MAVRRAAQPQPAEDWQQRLAQIEGVTVTGKAPAQVHFTATDEAIDKVRQEFPPSFLIEEAAERQPL
jgi:hypothetical protein